MSKFILTVTLNPAVDKTLNVSDFCIGKDFREEEIHVCAGGKGINVSEVLTHLNIPTLTTGFLGGTSGEFIKQQLDDKKIEHNFVKIKGNTRTSHTIINPRNDKITRVLERGPKINRKELNDFIKKYNLLLKSTSLVVLSGRSIPGAPDDVYANLIKKANKLDIPCILDTSGKAFLEGIKQKPYIIKPNISEAEELLNIKLNTSEKLKQAAICFYNMGIKIVTISLGSSGAIVYDGKTFYKAIPPKIKRRSPVGCGDAFIAGLSSALYNRESIQDAILMATACGAANALSVNPGFIKPGSIKQNLEKVKIKII